MWSYHGQVGGGEMELLGRRSPGLEPRVSSLSRTAQGANSRVLEKNLRCLPPVDQRSLQAGHRGRKGRVRMADGQTGTRAPQK
jgi:hypothetical protein